MKIIMITFWKLLNSQGGAEKVFCNMANALVEKGHELVLICSQNLKNGKLLYPIDNRAKLINVGVGLNLRLNVAQLLKTTMFFSKRKRDEYRDCIKDKKRADAVRPIIEKFKPDVIISHNDIATRIIKNYISKDIPVVTMFHGNPSYQLEHATSKTLESLSQSECVQVLMPSYIDDLKRIISCDNIVCIPNAVPQYDLDDCKLKENMIIYPARIEPGKRQDILIDAFSEIASNYPDWNIELWGGIGDDTLYYKHIVELIEAKNLSSRVIIKGVSNNIFRELCRAKLCVFTSASEGFSLALTEAMAAGVPVIALNDCKFACEFIEDGVTGIISPCDKKNLSVFMGNIISNMELRHKLSVNARNLIKEYSEEKVWAEWSMLLNILVKKKV